MQGLLEHARELLNQIPPDLPGLDELDITPDEATQLAYEYSKACWCEGLDNYGQMEEYYSWCNCDSSVVPGYHSSHLYEVLAFLLKRGADPNYEGESSSLMQYVIDCVNGYAAADSLRLLLEYGGDPNLATDGERLFPEIAFDVEFGAANQEDRRRYDSLVHCWMVLIGFGGKSYDGSDPVDFYKVWSPEGFHQIDPESLKNHENYSFCITYLSTHGGAPTIHIFDKRTYWEVVRY